MTVAEVLNLLERERDERGIAALLIDDPKKITREQAEQQVDQLHSGMLAHVFSSCDATLAKTPFVIDLADQWIRHGDRAP
ncbi:MAG TPA: hypothetical protein DEG76_13255 [Pseudohongiella sp.]|nr:hypothetical protein [Pseudohongiella sp.]HBX38189.1 hypothetical protein [Pseudohongiella sp.]|tara:strand:- start:9558 stop:9797 length:240 start_codon:yes stop_codon:yes gene_type:complete